MKKISIKVVSKILGVKILSRTKPKSPMVLEICVNCESVTIKLDIKSGFVLNRALTKAVITEWLRSRKLFGYYF